MASQSVWGTFESQLLMRRLTTVGANLLFLWALSPIGGQASLRLLATSTSTNQTSASLRYLSTGPGSAVAALDSGVYVENYGTLTQVQTFYAAALFSSDKVKQGPEDTWGNVKIPYWDPSNQTHSSLDGWVNVTANSRRPEDFSSLVGIPMVGRPSNRDVSFSVETTQLTVECEPFAKLPISNAFDSKELFNKVPGVLWNNTVTPDNPWGNSSGTGKASTFFLQTDLKFYSGDDDDHRFDKFTGSDRTGNQTFQKRKITYASVYGWAGESTVLRVANCSLGQVHTETLINCTKDQCAAVQMRPSRTDLRDEQVTQFDHFAISDYALIAFPQAFGWS